MSYLSEIDLRCKKCNRVFKADELDGGYCSICITQFPNRCSVCKEPITKLEYLRRQGFCSVCHMSWLKGVDSVVLDNNETYPGTGV